MVSLEQTSKTTKQGRKRQKSEWEDQMKSIWHTHSLSRPLPFPMPHQTWVPGAGSRRNLQSECLATLRIIPVLCGTMTDCNGGTASLSGRLTDLCYADPGTSRTAQTHLYESKEGSQAVLWVQTSKSQCFNPADSTACSRSGPMWLKCFPPSWRHTVCNTESAGSRGGDAGDSIP